MPSTTKDYQLFINSYIYNYYVLKPVGIVGEKNK